MKRTILIVVNICFAFLATGQKYNIQSAANSLKEKDYANARKFIELAVADPSTSKDPKAWFVKGTIFLTMQEDAEFQKISKGDYFIEAATSYMKVMEIKPDFQKEELSNGLLRCLYYYYNSGAVAYNNKKYDDAITRMKEVVNIASLDNGKIFASLKSIDTITAQAKYIRAASSYLAGKYDEAMPLLTEAKGNMIAKKPLLNFYIIDIYKKQGKENSPECLAAIQESRKEYPNDEEFKVEELNYYIRTGKTDELLKKLEENVVKDPNKPELSFDLAILYQNMAFPKDKPKPANHDELVKKAEASFENSLRVSPDNTEYNYSISALYFNDAAYIVELMNNLGTSPADQKKYNDLKKTRDGLFDKALPHLEKVYNLLDPKVSTLTNDERNTYKSTLLALKQIYAITNKKTETDNMKKKLEAIK